MSDDAVAALTVVGSGTLLPDPRRGSASFHVDVDGRGLLLDAGSGTLHGLPRAGVDWRAIDTIAVTHFHPDHVSDLPALLAAYRFEQMQRPLTLVGPKGFEGYLERLAAVHGEWILEPSRPLTVVEVGEGRGWRSDDAALGLDAVSTRHTDESVAYRVEVAARRGLSGSAPPSDRGSGRDGRDGSSPISIGYTGDTGPSSEVAVFLEGCAVVVAECALEDPPEIDTHLSPGSVAELAAAAAPTLLVVSHVYPPRRPDDAVRAIRARYDGRVVAAADGLRVSIAPDRVTVDLPQNGP